MITYFWINLFCFTNSREGHEIKILLSTPDFNAMGITEWPKTKIFQFWSKNPSGNHTWVYRT